MSIYIRIVLYLIFVCICQSIVFSQSGSNNSNKSNQPEEKIYTAKEITKKAVILSKPNPEYTSIAQENRVTGTVELRAVFRSSGKVTNVQTVRGLPDGLTEQAIEAARKIKFKPAEKDGRPVSTFVMIEYKFRL